MISLMQVHFTGKKTQKEEEDEVSQMRWRPKATAVTKRRACDIVSTNEGLQNYETKYSTNF
jgi:hypothetical protein